MEQFISSLLIKDILVGIIFLLTVVTFQSLEHILPSPQLRNSLLSSQSLFCWTCLYVWLGPSLLPIPASFLCFMAFAFQLYSMRHFFSGPVYLMFYRTNLFPEILGVFSYDFIENNFYVFVLEFFSCFVHNLYISVSHGIDKILWVPLTHLKNDRFLWVYNPIPLCRPLALILCLPHGPFCWWSCSLNAALG